MVAVTRLTPKTRMTVMEIVKVFIKPLDEILAEYRKLPELFYLVFYFSTSTVVKKAT
jgi:hypothetical protein